MNTGDRKWRVGLPQRDIPVTLRRAMEPNGAPRNGGGKGFVSAHFPREYVQPIGRQNYARANTVDRFHFNGNFSLIGKVYDSHIPAAVRGKVLATGILPTVDMYYDVIPAHEGPGPGRPRLYPGKRKFGGQVPLHLQPQVKQRPPWARGAKQGG